MMQRNTAALETEYEALMARTRKHLHPERKHGEVVVLRTAKGNLRVAEIPDYQDHETREPLENACIRQLAKDADSRVLTCLATVDGEHPEILSWNFRSGLIRLNGENMDTLQFLWGGGENILVKPFSALLPPEK